MRCRWLVAAGLIAASSVLSPVSAEVSNVTCEEQGIAMNSIFGMRLFAQGSVKLFTIDRDEPAYAPMGVAVTIDRDLAGNDEPSDVQSFCRYIGGMSEIELTAGKASYDEKKGLLTVKIPVKHRDDAQDTFVPGTLTLVIDKAAKKQGGLVKATLK